MRFLILCLLFTANASMAHQPDLSTTMLFQRPDGNWMLQITSSLSAFQEAIKVRFPDKTYSDAQEFQKLVLAHLRENLFFCVNNDDTLQLGNAFVKMGHETSVVFEVSAVPEQISTLEAQNCSFRYIHGNQSVLILNKEGLSMKHILLNNDNAHRAHLRNLGGQLQLNDSSSASLVAPEKLIAHPVSFYDKES